MGRFRRRGMDRLIVEERKDGEKGGGKGRLEGEGGWVNWRGDEGEGERGMTKG